jgi:amino acid transporter
MNRRQGVLPWPRFFVSTRPFGTPLGPYFVKWFLTAIMILAPPAGDAFNFVVDLKIYPMSLFNLTLAIGIYLVRHRRARAKLPRATFKAWDIAVVFNIAVNLYMIVMPWYPPPTGRNGGDVSFWYATYVVVGISVIIACGIYYVAWIYLIPKARGYRIRQEVLILDDGAQSHSLIKVPVERLVEWDANHDALGRTVREDSGSEARGSGDEKITVETGKV